MTHSGAWALRGQWQRKFSNLKGTYRKIVDNSRKMGTGGLGKKKWPYMDFFDNMYGNKPETDPVAVEVGEEPIANAASGVTQEGNGENISGDDIGREECQKVKKHVKNMSSVVLRFHERF